MILYYCLYLPYKCITWENLLANKFLCAFAAPDYAKWHGEVLCFEFSLNLFMNHAISLHLHLELVRPI